MVLFLEFILTHPDLIEPDNAMQFISDDGGETYNRCHCEFPSYAQSYLVSDSYPVWSNFEIGNLDLWRGEGYSKFFDFLDEKGGFYYERWGDAPVHSIGAALFAKKDQIVSGIPGDILISAYVVLAFLQRYWIPT